jgi:hypothetical protein
MDVRAATFSQRELCQITGLDTVTVDTWLIRGILETTKVDGRVLRGRRLFSVLTIFEAKVTADLVNELAMGPSEASNVARCAGADWHAPDDWKRKVVEAIERSANVARVFLLVARADEGWITIPSYANKNGPPRFEPMSKYEKWLARPLAVLPASDLLSFVYKKCGSLAPATPSGLRSPRLAWGAARRLRGGVDWARRWRRWHRSAPRTSEDFP